MNFARISIMAAAAAMTLQPTVAAAQQPCITEDEVSAVAIYSVPSVIQGVRLRCNGELSSSGYLARRGDALIGRYAAIQNRVWPTARSGLVKVLSSRAGEGRDTLAMVTRLPDNAVRPLVDALIVQEVSPKIATSNCSKIERLIEVAAPIDPEVAGTLLGVAAGLADPEQMPVCPARRA
jgi:hypothetical protein